MPRVKSRRDLAGPLQRDGGRQFGIRAQHPGTRRAHGSGVEVDDLTGGVNAGVGAARADRDDGVAGDECDRILHRVLQ